MGWNDLPSELRHMVFDHLIPEPVIKSRVGGGPFFYRPLSKYAAVAREWQLSFESATFKYLTIRQSDLPSLAKIVTEERRPLIHGLWMHVELPTYDCESCDMMESDEEAHDNNVIFTTAIWDLFNILSKWNSPADPKDRQAAFTLGLNVYSPSDREHHFRDHRFEDDGFFYYTGYRIISNGLFHDWYSDVRVNPGLGPKLRLFGKPLALDLRLIGEGSADPDRKLPTLDMICGLWVPRECYRAIPQLDLIIGSLPKLQDLRVESWRPVTSVDDRLRDLDLRRMIEALPPGLQTFSLFEDRSEVLHPNVRMTEYLMFELAHINASYMFDAFWFLWPYHPCFRGHPRLREWTNLETLTLTSCILTGRSPRERIDKLLRAAACAALQMPKLRVLEIWNSRQGRASFFRYTDSREDGPLLEWAYTAGTAAPHRVSERVMRAWQAVADKYKRGHPLRLRVCRKRRGNIRSHVSLVRDLETAPYMLTPQSYHRVQREERSMRNARRTLPPY